MLAIRSVNSVIVLGLLLKFLPKVYLCLSLRSRSWLI
jgi:hypothetical protein